MTCILAIFNQTSCPNCLILLLSFFQKKSISIPYYQKIRNIKIKYCMMNTLINYFNALQIMIFIGMNPPTISQNSKPLNFLPFLFFAFILVLCCYLVLLFLDSRAKKVTLRSQKLIGIVWIWISTRGKFTLKQWSDKLFSQEPSLWVLNHWGTRSDNAHWIVHL